MDKNLIAYLKDRRNKIVLKKGTIPKCNKNEMVLKIIYAGICRTDIQFYSGQRKGGPSVLGHECLAQIVNVGKEIRGFVPGEKVTLNPNSPTDETRKIGHIPCLPGVFQKYYLVLPELIFNNQIIKLEKIHGKESILLEGLSCVVNAQERVKKFIKGKKVLIIGAGTMGQLHALTAKVYGAKEIFLANRSVEKLQDAVIRGTVKKNNIIQADDNLSSKLMKLTSGKGLDLVIVIVSMGEGLSVAKKAINYVCDNGAIYLFGGFYETDTCILSDDIKIPFGYIRLKWDKIQYEIGGKKIIFVGSRGSKVAYWKKAISLVEKNKIALDKLITHTISLDHLPDAIEQLCNGSKLNGKICLKAVIDMNLKSLS